MNLQLQLFLNNNQSNLLIKMIKLFQLLTSCASPLSVCPEQFLRPQTVLLEGMRTSSCAINQ